MNENRRKKKGLVLTSVLFFVLLIPNLCSAAVQDMKPPRGKYVPSDLNLKTHPFVENLKSPDQYLSAILVDKSNSNWTIRAQAMDGRVTIPIENVSSEWHDLSKGSWVLVQQSSVNDSVLVVGPDRRYKYLMLLIITIGVCLSVGGIITLRSLFAVFIGIAWLFFWSIPRILSGAPILYEISIFYVLETVIILSASLGVNKKAISAICTSLCAGLISGSLVLFIIHWIQVTGMRNETIQVLDFAMRYFPKQTVEFNIRQILTAMTLIGVFGVILDVCVDVTSSTAEINKKRPDLPIQDLVNRSLKISSRLIGTMTNTLLLAYIGADLFLIITLSFLPTSWRVFVNQDFVAVELIRGLGGSLGFILAAPLSVVIYWFIDSKFS